MMFTRQVLQANGMPAMCYLCQAPAITFINTSVNAAGIVPAHFEPVCRDHDPYKFEDMVIVPRVEWEDLKRRATLP